MTYRIVLAAAFVAGITALTATASFAQWAQSEREEFARDCVQSCRANDKVPSDRKGQCVDYCACVGDAAERTEPNYKVLNDDFLQQRDTPRVRAVKNSVPACNQKAFR